MKKMPLGWVLTVVIAISVQAFTVIFASGRLAERIETIDNLNNKRYEKLDHNKVNQAVFDIHLENIHSIQVRILNKLDDIEARIRQAND